MNKVRAVPLIALIAGIALLPLSVAVAVIEHAHDEAAVDRSLTVEADEHAGKLEAYFQRARPVVLVTAQNPAFADFYA